MAQINNGAFTAKLKLILNEKVETDKKDSKGDVISEYKEVSRVDLPIPLLSDFGIEAEQAIDEKTKELAFDEDGLPVYKEVALDWLFGAIIAQSKAQSRNKFVKGVLKDNNKLAENFAELTAVGDRSGDALKARHDARKAYAAWLESKGKKPTIVKMLSDLFGDVNSIAYAKDNFVTALKTHLPEFVTTLSETDKVRYANTINKIVEALEASKASLEDMT